MDGCAYFIPDLRLTGTSSTTVFRDGVEIIAAGTLANSAGSAGVSRTGATGAGADTTVADTTVADTTVANVSTRAAGASWDVLRSDGDSPPAAFAVGVAINVGLWTM